MVAYAHSIQALRRLSATSSHLAEILIADIQPSYTQFEIWHEQSVTGSNAKNKCLSTGSRCLVGRWPSQFCFKASISPLSWGVNAEIN